MGKQKKFKRWNRSAVKEIPLSEAQEADLATVDLYDSPMFRLLDRVEHLEFSNKKQVIHLTQFVWRKINRKIHGLRKIL